MSRKVAILGSGIVGETLATGFLRLGDEVVLASRDPAKLERWRKTAGPKVLTGSFADAAAWGDIVVLAVKGTGAESAVESCGARSLAGKVVIDTTNPIADEPPEDGVLRYFTDMIQSLMERLQFQAPEARFVKAFSCVGNAYMLSPTVGGHTATMFICENDARAKKDVTDVLTHFGWEVEDLGTAKAARAIEPLAMLWCIPGFIRDTWSHAFKLLKG